MRPNFFTTALAVLLTITLVAPSAFFIAPQKTYAQLGGPSFETNPLLVLNAPKTAIESTISAIQNTLTKVSSFTTSVAETAANVNTYVLQPLAFALSGRLTKALTASVIKFTIGETNRSGLPQFVTDTKAMMQSVGDSQALAYIKQFNINSNSPFASAISSSLRSNYLENTTLAGAWAANMDTLERASNDKYRFLNGDWSQGGAGAWMALTTQNQNNPYSLYITMQSKMGSLVINAQTARTNEIAQGQGFLSWCGGGTTKIEAYTTTLTPLRVAQLNVDKTKANYDNALNSTNTDLVENPNYKSDIAQTKKDYDAAQANFDKLSKGTELDSSKYALWHACSVNSDCKTNKCDKGICAIDNSTPVGINPGDPCTNEDGTQGTIKTPGSVIAASLNKALGGTQDTLTQMGSMAKEVNGIFKNIGTVMNTVKFASDILGGDYNKGGLYGVNSKSGMNSNSAFANYNGSDYFGVTDTMVRAGNATTDDMPARIAKYQSAWNTIKIAADTASSSVLDLKEYCTSQGVTAKNKVDEGKEVKDTPLPIKLVAQAEEAQNALEKEILPVLAQVAKAKANIAAATSIIDTADAANNIVKSLLEIKEFNDERNSPEQALLYGPTGYTDTYAKNMVIYNKNLVIYNENKSLLTTMAPTFDDVGNAQQDAKSLSSAKAEPEGSLTVSAETLLDKMNLITKNAKLLKPLCDARFAFATPSAVTEARSRIKQYQVAWTYIGDKAKVLETGIVALENFCINQKKEAQSLAENPENLKDLVQFIGRSDAQAAAARGAFSDIVFPALNLAAEASTTADIASKRVTEIEGLLSTADTGTSTYKDLIRELQTMPPTYEDVTNAQKNARRTEEAKADPKFSLTISEGPLYDRLTTLGYQIRGNGGFSEMGYSSDAFKNNKYINLDAPVFPPANKHPLQDGMWPWESCDLEAYTYTRDIEPVVVEPVVSTTTSVK